MDQLQALLQPYYLVFKWIHVFFVAMWAFSTAVAYRYYVVPVFNQWLKDRNNPELTEKRNWTFEAFDRGVILEHVAFPVILLTGLTMLWLNDWPLDKVYWLTVKLMIVAIFFIPMEIVDYHISHFGGRKALSLAANDADRYERQIQYHWKFFRVTAPIVRIGVPAVFFLAVAKPF